MATNKRKRAIRDLAAERGISYTAAMRLHDSARGRDDNESNQTPRATSPTPWTFTLGTRLDAGGSPYRLTLAGASAHLLVSGGAASGKTRLVEHVVDQALSTPSVTPDQVCIFDRLNRCAPGRGTRPSTVPTPSSGLCGDTEFEPLVQSIQSEVTRRADVLTTSPRATFPPLLVVVDDLPLTADEGWENCATTAAHIATWVLLGRPLGLSVVAARRNPIADGALRDSFGARVFTTRHSTIAEREQITALSAEAVPLPGDEHGFAAVARSGPGQPFVPLLLPTRG